MKEFIRIGLIFGIISSLYGGDDFSQWRGMERDGKYPDKNLLTVWPGSGPDIIWSTDILGDGYSSPAVTSNGVYVTGMTDGIGYMVAFDLSGKQRWRMTYGPEWDSSHKGARTTPTVIGDKIYLMSGEGNVVCVSTSNGKILWKVDMIKSFGARNLRWGMAESLLVDRERVFCTAGGSDVLLAVLNRHTGETIRKIKGNGEKSTYCSPVLIKHQGKRYILTMTEKSVVGFDAESGDHLWSYEHISRRGIHPNTPLYQDGFIYVVSGYGKGGLLLTLAPDGKSVEEIWSDDMLDSQMGAAVIVDGYIYGSGHKNKGWHCLDWKTGKVMFTANEFGDKGNIIFADGLLYCYDEDGDVGLVKPSPEKFEVISSFEVSEGSGPHWAHPVISIGRLYIRHGEVLQVYNITQK